MPIECSIYTIASFLIPVSYVGLIYAFDDGAESKYHPSSIKKRFTAATCNNIFAVFLTFCLLSSNYDSPFEKMGFRCDGLLYASVFPAALTILVYLGNVAAEFLQDNGEFEWHFMDASSDRRLTFMKYALVGPITEEIAFRGCSAVLVDHCLGRASAIFICPLFFSICHFHHILEDLRNGNTFMESFLKRAFQMLYTYLFGIYATVVFFSTGHILSPIISHIICNLFGLPNVIELDNFHESIRRQILAWNVVGLVLWFSSFAALISSLFYV